MTRALATTVASGTSSVLAGGKFANGAVTTAFEIMFAPGLTNNLGNALKVTGDIIGKIWTLPNTIVGAVYGGVGHMVGEIGFATGLYDVSPSISFGNNAIQFLDNPFTIPGTAITLGNTISYGRYAYPAKMGAYGDYRVPIGLHEKAHTYQYQVLGPFFLPTYFFRGGVSGPANNPLENAAQNYGSGAGNWWPW